MATVKYEIYTDGGACAYFDAAPNPKKAQQYACCSVAVLHANGTPVEAVVQGFLQGTNNQAEMVGVALALKDLINPNWHHTTIYTDSEYVQKGLTLYVQNWMKNGWLTADKKPVKNRDLWLWLIELGKDLPYWLVHVKGHSGNAGNELADTLAAAGATIMKSRRTFVGYDSLPPVRVDETQLAFIVETAPDVFHVLSSLFSSAISIDQSANKVKVSK